MRHFTLEEWADFVRGLGEPTARNAMAAHLQTGCATCTRHAEVLGRAARVMAADALLHVPDRVIQRARALFDGRQVDPMRLPRLVARLMFDSALAPAAVGLRAGEQPTRRTLFHAGSFVLDLRFEHEAGSPILAMVGQLASREEEPVDTAGRPVLLTAGKDVVARTITNRFGEFQMEYKPVPHMRLHVPVAPDGRIELPLSKLTAGMAELGGRADRRKERNKK